MFKTPDLLLKLKTEGLASQGDNQAEISRILDSVAIPNSKGCWSLKPSSMSMVDVNWQFYSEPDKQLVKRSVDSVVLMLNWRWNRTDIQKVDLYIDGSYTSCPWLNLNGVCSAPRKLLYVKSLALYVKLGMP